jgi:hypothetical protein
MPITESSITLNFPDKNYFRFENCQGYKNLSHIKEMDACWYDQANDKLYLIELKNWENNSLEEEKDPSYSSDQIQEMKERISNHRIGNLLKKSIDSTCMFTSILLNRPYSSQLQKCIPFTISTNTKIILLSIINWTDTDTTYISTINTQYKSKFKSYADLFDIKAFLVLTKDMAAKKFDWIS